MEILVVDDNKETTSMLSAFFQSKGFTCESINEPFEALELIQKKKIRCYSFRYLYAKVLR